MQTAKATVSDGRFARVRISCTAGTDGVATEAVGGMRFARWTAGPGSGR